MTNQTENNIITIDGPAGSGKSTIAQLLSQKLGWTHMNTGAIYRTFVFLLKKHFQSNLPDPQNLDSHLIAKFAEQMNQQYKQANGSNLICLGDENITNEIRTPEISHLASLYAQNSFIREQLLPLQRKLAQDHKGIIVDGRDMGTIVFPNARLKVFLTANSETRAKRRFSELQSDGLNVNFETLLAELKERDLRDSTREIAPSKPAEDAVIVDSSEHSINEVVDIILNLHQQES